MATSNRERVGSAMDRLKEGLLPFVEQMMQSARDKWFEVAQESNPGMVATTPAALDVQVMLKVIRDTWNDAFARRWANRSAISFTSSRNPQSLGAPERL